MILSRLDYCNSLYYGLPAISIQKLQRIMNSACLIFILSPGSPTANYIKQLHWLPIKQRVLYKILLFGHRLVHHPWKALVFRNDKMTGCQYAYKLKVPADANFSNNATLLGFNFDSRFSYTKQVSSVSWMFLFLAKNLFSQRYSRQKIFDRVSSGNDSLATRLLQLTVLWTTCH